MCNFCNTTRTISLCSFAGRQSTSSQYIIGYYNFVFVFFLFLSCHKWAKRIKRSVINWKITCNYYFIIYLCLFTVSIFSAKIFSSFSFHFCLTFIFSRIRKTRIIVLFSLFLIKETRFSYTHKFNIIQY